MNKTDVHMRAKILAVVILLGLTCFLFWNFFTTKQVLNWNLGAAAEITALAVGISLVDLAGLARIATPAKTMKEEPLFIWILTTVWLLSVATDVILTYFYVAMRMELHLAQNPVRVEGMEVWFPWAVAIIEVGIRVPLVILVGQYGDKLLRSTGEEEDDFSRSYRKARPTQRAPQPVATSSRRPEKPKKSPVRLQDYLG